MNTPDPLAAQAPPRTPANYDRRSSDRPGERWGESPPAPSADGPYAGFSSDDVNALVRLWRLAWAHRGLIVAVAAALGAGRFVRPEYVLPAAGIQAPPVASTEVQAELRQLHGVDSQLRHFADSSRLDRARLNRDAMTTRTALARGICAMQTPQQRELGGLPCSTLLNGGEWDTRGMP